MLCLRDIKAPAVSSALMAITKIVWQLITIALPLLPQGLIIVMDFNESKYVTASPTISSDLLKATPDLLSDAAAPLTRLPLIGLVKSVFSESFHGT